MTPCVQCKNKVPDEAFSPARRPDEVLLRDRLLHHSRIRQIDEYVPGFRRQYHRLAVGRFQTRNRYFHVAGFVGMQHQGDSNLWHGSLLSVSIDNPALGEIVCSAEQENLFAIRTYCKGRPVAMLEFMDVVFTFAVPYGRVQDAVAIAYHYSGSGHNRRVDFFHRATFMTREAFE